MPGPIVGVAVAACGVPRLQGYEPPPLPQRLTAGQLEQAAVLGSRACLAVIDLHYITFCIVIGLQYIVPCRDWPAVHNIIHSGFNEC